MTTTEHSGTGPAEAPFTDSTGGRIYTVSGGDWEDIVAAAQAGDDLVPVASRHVVYTALGGIRLGICRTRRRVRGLRHQEYDLLSSGGGTLVPRYSTGMPPSG